MAENTMQNAVALTPNEADALIRLFLYAKFETRDADSLLFAGSPFVNAAWKSCRTPTRFTAGRRFPAARCRNNTENCWRTNWPARVSPRPTKRLGLRWRFPISPKNLMKTQKGRLKKRFSDGLMQREAV